jgi:pyruvate/2-oxoglutarate dehydrogenase complex dihydrolipoamide dehydrogenase (E3) component
VRLDARGNIEVDSQLRSTSAPHIWALGDINGRGQFTHTSYNDFEIVAANLLDNEPRKVEDRILIYGLFSDPPLGRVGMTEREVRERGRPYLRGVRPMSRVGRARERGETRGFIKLLADADSKQFLGAAIFGVEGDEVVHCIADLMYAKAPYTVLTHAVHTHPTVSELLPTVAGSMELVEPSQA